MPLVPPEAFQVAPETGESTNTPVSVGCGVPGIPCWPLPSPQPAISAETTSTNTERIPDDSKSKCMNYAFRSLLFLFFIFLLSDQDRWSKQVDFLFREVVRALNRFDTGKPNNYQQLTALSILHNKTLNCLSGHDVNLWLQPQSWQLS